MVFKNKKQTKAIGRNKVFPIIFLKFFSLFGTISLKPLTD